MGPSNMPTETHNNQLFSNNITLHNFVVKLFFVLLTKSVAFGIIKFKARQHYYNNKSNTAKLNNDKAHIHDQEPDNINVDFLGVRGGVRFGLMSAAVLQVWNVIEVYCTQSGRETTSIIFYIASMVFIIMNGTHLDLKSTHSKPTTTADGGNESLLRISTTINRGSTDQILAENCEQIREVIGPQATLTAGLLNLILKYNIQSLTTGYCYGG